MCSDISKATVILLVLAASTLAGCLGSGQDQEYDEPPEDHINICQLKLYAEQDLPDDAFVMVLNESTWKRLAPLFAARLVEYDATHDQSDLPGDIGGECDDGYLEEAERLIGYFEQHLDARKSVDAGGREFYYFEMATETTGNIIGIYIEWYEGIRNEYDQEADRQ